jgi:hypothetical protein
MTRQLRIWRIGRNRKEKKEEEKKKRTKTPTKEEIPISKEVGMRKKK